MDPGFGPADDKRHWPDAPGGRMRDSLYWQTVLPDERLGVHVYLYLTDRGKTGFIAAVWGPDAEPVALEMGGGTVDDDMDLDDFTIQGLRVRQPELRRTADVVFAGETLSLEYRFEGIQDAFSYRCNPDGLPSWFAANRLEQTGRIDGFVDIDGRRIPLDGRLGHRDHSWGTRDWGVPQHWKWFVVYTADGTRAVNGWIWIARGDWGFAGSVLRDGATVPVSRIEHRATYDEDMSQRRLEATLVDTAGGRTGVTLDRFGLLKLPTGGRIATEIWESACDATIDGEPAAGQWETHWPSEYLAHLVESGHT